MKPIIFSASCALAFLAWAAPSSPASPAPLASAAQIVVKGVGMGPMVCLDCEAPGPVSVTICNSASVSVTAGGGPIGSFSTGQSTSACVTVPTVPPGTCVWLEYHYECTRGGFFGTWQCTPKGANTMFGPNPFC